VAHTCHSTYGGKLKIGGLWSRLVWAKSKTYLQKHRAKRAGEMSQVAEHLSSKHITPEFKSQYHQK
jgi:hypothetical protein